VEHARCDKHHRQRHHHCAEWVFAAEYSDIRHTSD